MSYLYIVFQRRELFKAEQVVNTDSKGGRNFTESFRLALIGKRSGGERETTFSRSTGQIGEHYMSRRKKQEQPPVWDLDFLQDWTVPIWTLDTLSEWETSMEDIQAGWDRLVAELQSPFISWSNAADESREDFSRDEAERK